MLTVDSKTIKSFCNEIVGMWCIENPTFRQKYNNYVSAALAKGYETGDFGWITRIIDATPDEKIRSKLTRNLMKVLPLSYRKKTQSIRGSCKTRLMSGIYFTCRGVRRGWAQPLLA